MTTTFAQIELGSAATSGEATTVTAVGDLTVHGVTTSVSIPLQVQLVDDTIVPIVLSAADNGVLELQLFFTKG